MFYWGLMLLWVMGEGFDNTCTVPGKWNVSRVIPRLYGGVYKTLRLFPLVVEHSVVVMSARLNAMGSQFSIPVLWNLCSESVVAWTVETQLRTPTLAIRVQLSLGWSTYFSILILWNLCGKPMRQKALFC